MIENMQSKKLSFFLKIMFNPLCVIIWLIGTYYLYRHVNSDVASYLFIGYIAIGYFAYTILKERKFLESYAQTHNLTFSETFNPELLTGRFFKPATLTSGAKIFNGSCLLGLRNNLATKLFYTHYLKGVGKYKIPYYFTFIEITLEQAKFPFMLLQKKSERRHYESENFGDSKDTEINISGMSSTYSLFTTQRYEIEALQICTPEFLAILESTSLPINVEFDDSHIYIFTNKHLRKEAELDELYRVTHAIIDKFGEFLMRMRDDYQVLHEVYTKNKD